MMELAAIDVDLDTCLPHFNTVFLGTQVLNNGSAGKNSSSVYGFPLIFNNGNNGIKEVICLFSYIFLIEFIDATVSITEDISYQIEYFLEDDTMLSKNGNIYLLRKRVINDVGRPSTKYVMGALHSHSRPVKYEPATTASDNPIDRVEIENTRDRKPYVEGNQAPQ